VSEPIIWRLGELGDLPTMKAAVGGGSDYAVAAVGERWLSGGFAGVVAPGTGAISDSGTLPTIEDAMAWAEAKLRGESAR
jgi:hypothetical protein